MALKLFTLAVALTGYAALSYARQRRQALPRLAAPRADSSESSAATARSWNPSPVESSGLPGIEEESPNTADRMQARNVLSSPMGTALPLGSRPADTDLFESSSQQGSGPRSIGLGDLTRGA
jgi:hypothetical protein